MLLREETTMIGFWLLVLVAAIAWFGGWEGLLGIGLVIVFLFMSGILTGLAGLSRRRKYKSKYHPVH